MLHLDPLVLLDLPFLGLQELRVSLEPQGVLAVMVQRERLSTTTEVPVTPEPLEPWEDPVLKEAKADLATQAALEREVRTESVLPVLLELQVLKETPE